MIYLIYLSDVRTTWKNYCGRKRRNEFVAGSECQEKNMKK